MRSVKERELKKVSETLTATSETYRGICSVCQNRSTCTYARNPQWPVVQCEEFVGYENEKINGKAVSQLADPMYRFSPERFRKFQRVV